MSNNYTRCQLNMRQTAGYMPYENLKNTTEKCDGTHTFTHTETYFDIY